MATELVRSYIGLGSNLGDRAGNLLLAVRSMLDAGIRISSLSGIYETEAVGVNAGGKFLNMVAEVETSGITVSQLMARLLRIEYQLGRTGKALGLPRTIDLDILLFGSLIYDSTFVTVPHPRMHQRKFVLAPMAEIAASVIHPTIGKSIQTLFNELSSQEVVARWPAVHTFSTAATIFLDEGI